MLCRAVAGRSTSVLRPADVLVPCSHTGTDKAEALDITVVDPSLPNMLARARSASVALNAAKKKHREKMTAHERQRVRASSQNAQLPFFKSPLVFESTGAWGPETVKWFDKMVRDNKQVNPPLLQLAGSPHTFTALSYSSMWSQQLSMVLARRQAESVLRLSQESLHRQRDSGVPGTVG